MSRTKGSKNSFKETQCALCNKFIITTNKEEYVYKLTKEGKRKYYCSYTCWRKAGGR